MRILLKKAATPSADTPAKKFARLNENGFLKRILTDIVVSTQDLRFDLIEAKVKEIFKTDLDGALKAVGNAKGYLNIKIKRTGAPGGLFDKSPLESVFDLKYKELELSRWDFTKFKELMIAVIDARLNPHTVVFEEPKEENYPEGEASFSDEGEFEQTTHNVGGQEWNVNNWGGTAEYIGDLVMGPDGFYIANDEVM